MSVFIIRGMEVSIPPGGFSLAIGDEGQVSGKLALHLRFDVCSIWVKLALRHLDEAIAKKELRVAAWAGGDEDQKAAALIQELEASMQAVAAAVTAVDAFYSLVKTYVKLPDGVIDKWRAKRTARYAQVTEVLKRAFRLKPKGVAALRHNLKEIYRVRDRTVHPSGKFEAPLLHPELGVGVERRFADFRANNAELVVNAATWILWDLANGGKPEIPQLKRYIDGLRERLAELFPNGHPFSMQQEAQQDPLREPPQPGHP